MTKIKGNSFNNDSNCFPNKEKYAFGNFYSFSLFFHYTYIPSLYTGKILRNEYTVPTAEKRPPGQETPADDCTMAKVCNHTWRPLCGHNEADSSYRLFLDDCDLFEYNCDNNKTYQNTDVKYCGLNCTRSDEHHLTTTPITTKKETEKTTEVTTSTSSTTTLKPDITDQSTITIASTTTNSTTTTTEKTSTTTKPTSTTTKPKTTPIYKMDCYPKDCTLPSTWETTSVGETRDFVQILNERFGKRVKILRNTSHFPKAPMFFRKSDNFIPGHYSETRCYKCKHLKSNMNRYVQLDRAERRVPNIAFIVFRAERPIKEIHSVDKDQTACVDPDSKRDDDTAESMSEFESMMQQFMSHFMYG
ncbi:hypothetical protein HW555_009773 [Spodoptera exigua]|uniref:Uncharacterized protein n=1 Tax=Spodoptera exigua TaxID=7107 RepID=A0A835L377_SPOEX|nr:hypothetical protein HW555_009773 [Spodoptera exigua]